MAFKYDESVVRILENTAEDEPIFILVARDDVGAQRALTAWLVAALEHNAEPFDKKTGKDRPRIPIAKIREATRCLESFQNYPKKKVPD